MAAIGGLFLLAPAGANLLAPSGSTTFGHSDGPAPLGPLPASACAGAKTAGSFTGSLIDDEGGSTPPSVSGVDVALWYWVTDIYTPTGGASTYSCTEQVSSATTDGTGGFSLTAPIPASGCGRYFCSNFSGPFGPLDFSTPDGVPAGFFLTQSVSGGQVGLAWVVALASAHLSPASRITLSASAPTVVRAYPTAGNGAASPAAVGFAWQLVGNGWSIVNGTGSANLTIEAFNDASPGALTVWVNGSYDGTNLSAPPATLEIAAESTSISQASDMPTSIDVGYPVTFTVTGEGAGGYTYVADISPGLGAATAAAPCTTKVVAGGLVALTCSTSIAYGAPGTAYPSTNLTNGYSFMSAGFAPVAVARTLGLSVTPGSPAAYVGAPVAVTIEGDAYTGTSPQGPACLWTGDGRTFCDDGPGPNYPFSITYGSAGTFSGRATLADAAGANESAPFTTTVYERPTISTVATSTNVLPVGQTATLVASVSGGALPLAYWWNSSSPSGTLFAGALTSDGTLEFTFVPRVAGSTTITLYVLDSLGTEPSVPTAMKVTAGPATNLLALVAGGGQTSAGTPTPVTWSAVDPSGEPVVGWAAPVAIVLAPVPGGPATIPTTWVNVSGVPVTGSEGTYPVPSDAWSLGVLRCTVDLAGRGDVLVSLTGGLPPLGGGSGAVELDVGPNTSAFLLSHPQTAVPGLRTNHTLWQISDRFGDALDGGAIGVDTFSTGTWENNSSRVLGNASAGTQVWVNYSVPDGVAATVFVVGPAGEFLLTPIAISVPSTTSPAPVADLLIAVGGALAAASAYGLWSRTRRRGPDDASGSPETPASEDELRRWAEGRAHVLQRASTERGGTLDELAQGFVGRPPKPDEMTDWVASLVADGSLRTVLGDDGRSRFLKAAGDDDTPLRVELDDRALAEALERRARLDATDADEKGG